MRFRRTVPRWASLAFVLVGLYVLLISLDVLPYGVPARRRALFVDPYHWQVTAIGIAFIALGGLTAFPRAHRACRLALNAVAVVGFFAPMLWLILDSPLAAGERMAVAVPTVLGLAGVVLGIHQHLTGRPFDPHSLDPMEAARILRTHGRPEQAEAVLRRAIEEEPGRREELQRAIDATRRHAVDDRR